MSLSRFNRSDRVALLAALVMVGVAVAIRLLEGSAGDSWALFWLVLALGNFSSVRLNVIERRLAALEKSR
jgi:fatty acid desaturase